MWFVFLFMTNSENDKDNTQKLKCEIFEHSNLFSYLLCLWNIPKTSSRLVTLVQNVGAFQLCPSGEGGATSVIRAVCTNINVYHRRDM